ncbi:MAG TPA: lactate utilization protein [Cytophagaceae bacterium]|jgi:L-lactate utilization protein LutB|nr:lactate utilization protein [Cytophagaceae bacterium]
MKEIYNKLASAERINAGEKALTANGFLPETVATGAEALARIQELIPKGASVMNGASRTLEEIGFIGYLKEGEHGWNNLHEAVLSEKDPAKQAELRKYSVVSDFYLGSVHALAETGELVIASASGSQLSHLAFTSPNLILIVGTQKIVPTLADAHKRIAEHVFPLEDARMKSMGYPGSLIGKELILHKEHPMMGRKVHVILVREKLGF